MTKSDRDNGSDFSLLSLPARLHENNTTVPCSVDYVFLDFIMLKDISPSHDLTVILFSFVIVINMVMLDFRR
jgi:hypothetical protein